MFVAGTFQAFNASDAAISDGLLAQKPPSRASILPSLVKSSTHGLKKGVAEHDALTASAIEQPKPGMNVPFILYVA